MEIPYPATHHVFFGKKSGLQDKITDSMKKATIEVGDIIKKMSNHVPESLFRNNVFLPAYMAKTALYQGTAVQAIFFFSFGSVRQLEFLIKISTKIQVPVSF
jgi:hypothetical protein